MSETVKNPSVTQTPAQQRARHALERVNAIVNEKFAGDYCSRVEALPATVLMNGLGQAVATLVAKRQDDPACRQLYADLRAWLCEKAQLPPYAGSQDLLEGITKNGQDDYLRAQAEALAYLEWLKKFAVAFLKKKETRK